MVSPLNSTSPVFQVKMIPGGLILIKSKEILALASVRGESPLFSSCFIGVEALNFPKKYSVSETKSECSPQTLNFRTKHWGEGEEYCK